MGSIRRRAFALGLTLVVILTAIVWVESAGAAPKKAKATPAVTAPSAPAAPEILDTPHNLQTAFTNELNAKQRYDAAAKKADFEGYPAVARLFRACGAAEKIHADRHVEAIAWGGGQAKAILERLWIGTTAENLRTAIDLENYEARELYPAMIARARADRQSQAVRSMTYALATERAHAQLLQSALDHLDRRAAVPNLYVCPCCGMTVESLSFKKCPNCFTSARRFTKVT
jgi:rubrerythrin